MRPLDPTFPSLTSLALLALPLVLLPMAALAQGPGPGPSPDRPPHPPTLTVSGSGQVRAAPDLATVRLGVLAQAPTAQAAQEQVNRIANGILDAVKKLGIKPEDLQTSDLSLNPVYSQPRPGAEDTTPRITGYQASNMVSVRFRDLAKIGPVIDAGLSAGANRLDSVSFGLENDQAARAAALTNAVKAARAKAETLAKAFEVDLVEILEISEGELNVNQPPFPRPQMAMMAMKSGADTSVEVGQLSVDASVSVRYRIAPAGARGGNR